MLVVPLNWGLGHATRIIPLIRRFIEEGKNVFIAGSPRHLKILSAEFPEIITLEIPYARIRFDTGRNLLLSLFWQLPAFLIQIIREHLALKKIIGKYNIGLVLSDNCYGLWNKYIHSIFLTHQVNIIPPPALQRLNKILNKINHRFIEKYDECWIPDQEEDGGYTGTLSHGSLPKTKISYIGVLSRFKPAEYNRKKIRVKPNQILFLISGPENQRTTFEDMIKTQLKHIPDDYDYVVVRGKPDETSSLPVKWYNHLPSDELMTLIADSAVIICRSGYSTIMDLLAMKKTAVLIPTPRQTEQEYLAQYLSSKDLFVAMDQNEFSIEGALQKLKVLGKHRPGESAKQP
ncbi:MAG: glycosyltransferase [Bacteroidales bacterium]|jgi:UDP-N-acetylglucosamine:LPS N-acetylglucosamine transferase